MTRALMDGATCVGELRLCARDVGFDLRLHDTAVELPDAFESVGIDGRDGHTYLITGTRNELVAAITDAGYRVREAPNAD